MRKIIFTIMIWIGFVSSLFAYEEISLNGKWEYVVSEQEAPSSEKTKWEEVEVPSLGWCALF